MSSNTANPDLTDMLTALKSPEMRRILALIIKHSRLLESSFVAQDTQCTAFYEGQRSIGIWLKQQIDKADPEAFARLITSTRRNTHV